MPADTTAPAEIFERARPRLWGLAYRMLGSAADADDAVQDTYLRWQAAGLDHIDTPEAWLTTVCTRRAIDMLRAARRARTDYVGPWLPEPVIAPEAGAELELAESLSTAFLLLLERLSPTERAAYLLREVFDYAYADVAASLNKSEAACRQLVSRARRHVGHDRARFAPPPERRQDLLESFLGAMQSGSVENLATLLSEDAELWSDGGGKVLAARNVIHGANNVARFLHGVWQRVWAEQDVRRVAVNGGAGLLLGARGTLESVVTFGIAPDGRIGAIYVVRNPDKLPGPGLLAIAENLHLPAAREGT